ncbi:MAG TPA: hypothetical protein VK191_12895 [Symbiobacteriaceae bacterium]|nr:hypothetical protein [Symbiobacteriaceae bacterium]
MADPNVLLVPVEVKALVVNDRVRIGQNFQRWSMNYQAMTNFVSPEPPPFSGNANDWPSNPAYNGVYLHWTLPAALRQGAHETATGTTTYPLVPNRWLVLRYSGPLGARTATAWVVESDFLDPNQGTSPYIDPRASSLQVTSIGRKVNLNNPQWTETGKPDLFLTAVSPANATFAAYQPYTENVFSIHDTLDGLSDQESLSYLVVGWYANSAKDPLADGEFTTLLQELGWSVSESETATQSIYHGLAWGVNWSKNGDAPSSAMPAPADVCLAVGNTSIDALTALIAKQAADAGKQEILNVELLEAFQYDLLPTLDQPDGPQILEQKIHEQWFGSQPGGYIWEIVARPGTDPDPNWTEPAWLVELNQTQNALDEARLTMQSMQWELYALWWKQQYAAHLPPNRYPSGMTPQMFADQLDPANQNGLLYKVYQQIETVKNLARQVPDGNSQSALAQAIATFAYDQGLSPQYELKRANRPRFYQANNPVVLLAGTNASGLLSTDDALPCRFPDQIVTGLTFQGQPITLASLKGGIPTLDLTNLPAVVGALLVEFFFLDPLNATLIAARGLGTSDPAVIQALQTTMTAEQSLIGVVPALDLAAWVQPWAPLFLMWEVDYYPISHDTSGTPNWTFDGTDYAWTGNGAQTTTAISLSGRIFLTPQCAYNFQAQLKKYLNLHPNPDLAALSDFITQTDGWDFLSQSLDGFQQGLSLRNPLANRTPDASTQLFPNVTLADLIAYEAEYTPGPSPTQKVPFQGWPASLFQEWRSGQFYFNRVMVVDRFGQSVEVVNSKTSAQFTPILAEGLQPTKTVLPQEPYRFVEPPLRLLQPGRLDFDFVSATDDNKVLNLDEEVNPVCAWVIPNHLDGALAFYDNQGGPLGELGVITNDQGAQQLNWTGAPGGPYQTVASLLPFPHLQEFINGLLNLGGAAAVQAFEDLLHVIDETLWTIDPLGNRDDQNLSVLVGRPLALCRTRLQFELDGPAISDPSWQYTFNPLAPSVPSYPFAIRLGALDLQQDGLLGYFTGTDYTTFHAVHLPEEVSDPYIQPIGTGSGLTLQFNSSSEAYLTMLVDPRAVVHATTGILPTTALSIPNRFVGPALANMALFFRVGPLLTGAQVSQDGSVTVLMPQPTEQNGTWSWLESVAGQMQPFPIGPVDQTAMLSNVPASLRTGYLQLSGALKSSK